MSNEIWREVKKVFYKLPASNNSEVFGKHRPSCSGFSFYEHFNRQFTLDNSQFFDIQNRKMCLNKKILHQYFSVFSPAWDSFSSENILCHYIALSEKRKREHD